MLAGGAPRPSSRGNSKAKRSSYLSIGTASMSLPHCDDLFIKFFDCWYDDTWRDVRGTEATRPDLYQIEGDSEYDARDFSPLNADGQSESASLIERIYESAVNDWVTFLKVKAPVDISWIDAWDRFYDRAEISKLISESEPDDFANGYVVSCCQFGAVMGKVLCDHEPNLQWIYSWPYWESSLFHPKTGTSIPVFHWAIKKMSEYGVDDGFAAKIKACCNVLNRQS